MYVRILLVLICSSGLAGLSAQAGLVRRMDFSSDVPVLRAPVWAHRSQGITLPHIQEPVSGKGLHSAIFLPPWDAKDLPVFCRIEHEIGRKIPIMVKFRLGSVEYVDWLEGKTDDLAK